MRRSKAGSRFSSVNLNSLWRFVISIHAKSRKSGAEEKWQLHLLLKERRLQSVFFTEIDICYHEGSERVDSF